MLELNATRIVDGVEIHTTEDAAQEVTSEMLQAVSQITQYHQVLRESPTVKVYLEIPADGEWEIYDIVQGWIESCINAKYVNLPE